MMFLHVLAVLSAILVRSVSGDAAPEQQVLAANTSLANELNLVHPGRELQAPTCCDMTLRPWPDYILIFLGQDLTGWPVSGGSCVGFDPLPGTCCPNGEWVCPALHNLANNNDGWTARCPGTPTIDRIPGSVVPGASFCDCCDRALEPLCETGIAGCCPEGRWACPKNYDLGYECDAGTLRKDIFPQGTVCGEGPRTYTVPSWWPILVATYTGPPRLRQCMQRFLPPVNGDSCGRNDKACFWGNQVCPSGPGSGPDGYPGTKCTCTGRTWNCEVAPCPP